MLASNPDEPLALSGLAMAYFVGGRTTLAAPVVARLSAVDPVSWLTHWCLGAVHFYAGGFDLAKEHWCRTYEMEPEHPGAQVYYAYALLCGGDADAALGVLEHSPEGDPSNALVRMARMLTCALRGEKEGITIALTSEMRQTFLRDAYCSHSIAVTYAYVGMRDEAFQWLEQAVSRGFINYPMLAEHDPMLGCLRGDERFKELMVRVKKEWEEFEE